MAIQWYTIEMSFQHFSVIQIDLQYTRKPNRVYPQNLYYIKTNICVRVCVYVSRMYNPCMGCCGIMQQFRLAVHERYEWKNTAAGCGEWRRVAEGGGGWRRVAKGDGRWRKVTECGEKQRKVAESGEGWRRVAEEGGGWRRCRVSRTLMESVGPKSRASENGGELEKMENVR